MGGVTSGTSIMHSHNGVHWPAVSGSREDSHALYTPLNADEKVVHQPVPRGWVTVHSQATLHGSGCATFLLPGHC